MNLRTPLITPLLRVDWESLAFYPCSNPLLFLLPRVVEILCAPHIRLLLTLLLRVYWQSSAPQPLPPSVDGGSPTLTRLL